MSSELSSDALLQTGSSAMASLQESNVIQSAACCGGCAQHTEPEAFVYALGRLEWRFPSVGLEREFRQRERAMEYTSEDDRARTAAVLRANPHLARSVCYVLSVGGLPAYVVKPVSREVLDALLTSLESPVDDRFDLIIGFRIGITSPMTCGGLLAPIVACEQSYSFTVDEVTEQLSDRAGPVIRAGRVDRSKLKRIAHELFHRIARASENVGALDSHRALNYLIVQHPGLFIAAAERDGKAALDGIDTQVELSAVRRVVTVIFTFVDRATGVPERLFTRVDVTEQWPFLAGGAGGESAGLGLQPFLVHTASASS